jgi:transcriptional regulator with XRE-family HTH domain
MLWNLIEEKKKQMSITQNQVAEVLGISPAYVTRLKQNDIIPSYDVANRIAVWLNISTGQVFDSLSSVSKN